MKLNKTSQKIDNNVCKALTIACETTLHEVPGFEWLSHRASYTNFPASLIVTCVFATDADIEAMKLQKQDDLLRTTIQKQLLKVGVVVKNISNAVHFDSEEACLRQHDGEWSARLALTISKQKPNNKNSKKGRVTH
jgi:hypothetical protein